MGTIIIDMNSIVRKSAIGSNIHIATVNTFWLTLDQIWKSSHVSASQLGDVSASLVDKPKCREDTRYTIL